MANTVSITDGSTTVQLNDGSNTLLLSYSMPPANPSFEEIEQLTDAAAITDPRLGTTTGSMRVLVIGSSESDLQDRVRSIERLLDTARRWRHTGTDVYLQAQLGSESDTWRTQILSGRLDTPDVGMQFPLLKMEVVIAVTRRFYWEGPETQITLTTSANATPTNEPTFYVDDDATASQTNWIGIAGTAIPGALPTPLKLALKNTSGSAVNWREFHIGHNVFSDPANYDAFLLGSESDGVGVTASWSGSGANAVLYYWTLSDTRLADHGGRMFRLLATFGTVNTTGTAYLRGEVTYVVGATHTALWSSGDIAITGDNSDEVLDFGAMPIPPGGFDGGGSQIGIRIIARSPSSPGTTSMDHLGLVPMDSYRRMVTSGFSYGNNNSLVDDGIDDIVYVEDASNNHFPVFTPLNRPVHAHPGRDQRLYVWTRESSGWESGREMSARAWIRARRITV